METTEHSTTEQLLVIPKLESVKYFHYWQIKCNVCTCWRRLRWKRL